MGGKSSTISSVDPRLGGIQVQTSNFGLTLPLVWGRARITGNLLDYDDFKAIPHTEVTESGGKGGGDVRQERTTWSYEATVILGLCVGPINGVLSAWKGKERFSGTTVAAQTRTLKHTVTVPAGGVVTVPSAGIFSRNVAVRYPNNSYPGNIDGP